MSILVLSLKSSLVCILVKESTVSVREQFGKFDDVLEPAGVTACLGVSGTRYVAGELSMRVRQLQVQCETKTKVC